MSKRIRFDQHFIRRVILALDLVSGVLGYALAMLCRFQLNLNVWKLPEYRLILVLMVMLSMLLNLYWRVQHRRYAFAQMEIFDVLTGLVRDRAVQYVLILILLYGTRTIDDISRLVLVFALIFDLILSAAGRIILRSLMMREQACDAASKLYICVTTMDDERSALCRLREWMPSDGVALGCVLMDAAIGSEKDGRDAVWWKDLEEQLIPGKTHVFVYLKDIYLAEAVTARCRKAAIPVHVFQFVQGLEIPGAMLGNRDDYAVIDYDPALKSGEVLGVRFVPTNVNTAVFYLLSALPLAGEYICFSNTHTTVMAHDDPVYREVLNGSAMTFPDGRPIARCLYNKGFEKCERVAGPDFMDAVFRATMDGRISHYFYGSTQETIDKLCEELPKRYPGIRIAGAVSPPFRPETPEEDAASVAAMNDSGAAFIWIGLGAPKQEKWMAAHRGRVNGLMLGVGAGFNFYAGTVKRAPKWMQKVGLEWLYRLFQDPKRLANRYIVTNVKFLWYMMTGAGRQGE